MVLLQNSMTRVWAELRAERRLMYCSSFAAFRVMFCDNKARIILKSRVFRDTPSAITVFDIAPFAQVELHTGTCGTPSEYDVRNLWLRFDNCETKRQWIPRPTAMTPDEIEPLTYYAELESAFYSIIHNNGVVEGKFDRL